MREPRHRSTREDAQADAALRSDDLVRAGSITKTSVATPARRLRAEGHPALDGAVSCARCALPTAPRALPTRPPSSSAACSSSSRPWRTRSGPRSSASPGGSSPP
ncbi:uncharacterized protein SOCE26_076690 [Sorangium cellulosum]|uniref:Uncharacterized protein n=1 Tax=Sorangium cellulosum TaxID=56 RepID=A0A2L0F3L2_SORCE|nr:uncharacterized protein SOCE26_076690 [Sorangium cellulosum]